MVYADWEYYLREYHGEGLRVDVEPLLEAASDNIDALTFNRIEAIGFDKLKPYQQEKVRRACCLQADFLLENAEAIASAVESYAINGVSMTFGNPALYSVVGGVPVRNSALSLLRATGLASGFVYPQEVVVYR